MSYIQNALIGYCDAEELLPLSEWIAEEALGISHTELILRHLNKYEGTDGAIEKINLWLQRIKMGEPWQYICGYTDFMGLRFKVNSSTLIPRPETAELINWIVQDNHGRAISVLDIGTGSGCIALQLKKQLPLAMVEGLDISPGAIQVASENAKANALEAAFRVEDILQAKTSSEQKYDIIVSNPPYICDSEKAEMSSRIKDFEPSEALFVSDNDPLLFYRTVAQLKWAPTLYFEINQHFGAETEKLLNSLGYRTELRQDMYGNCRMVKAIFKFL